MHGLFRAEAIDHASRPKLGVPAVTMPAPAWALWLSLGLLLLVGLAAFLFLPVPQIRSVPGWITPDRGVVTLSSPSAWRIIEVNVEEGQAVHRGKLLFTAQALQANSASDDYANNVVAEHGTQQGLNEQQIELVEASNARRSLTLERERDARSAALSTLLRQQELQRERVAIAKQDLKDVQPLVAKGYVSKLDLHRREDAALRAEQGLSEILERISGQRADLQSLDRAQQIAELESGQAVAVARKQMATSNERKTEALTQSRIAVRSPVDGRIAALRIQSGLTTGAGEFQLSILPSGYTLLAELFVPASSVAAIAVGKKVRLRVDAFPSSKFGSVMSTVTHVSSVTISPSQAPPGFDEETPVFLVRARLEPSPKQRRTMRFRPGMRLTADVVTERRSLASSTFSRD